MQLKRRVKLEGEYGSVKVRLRTEAGHSLYIPDRFFKQLAKALHQKGISGTYEVSVLEAVKGTHHIKGLSLWVGEEQRENCVICRFQSGSNDSCRRVMILCTDQTLSAEEIRERLQDEPIAPREETASADKSADKMDQISTYMAFDPSSHALIEAQRKETEETLNEKTGEMPMPKWTECSEKLKAFVETLHSLIKDSPEGDVSRKDLYQLICQAADVNVEDINVHSIAGQVAQLVRSDGLGLLEVSKSGVSKRYTLSEKAKKLIGQDKDLALKTGLMIQSSKDPAFQSEDEEIALVGSVAKSVLRLRRAQAELEEMLAQVKKHLDEAREVLNSLIEP